MVGKAGHSSIEHLVLIKTWMLNMEVNNGSGIFQGFDMEKFFDKESLIDTLNLTAKHSYHLIYSS